MIGLEIVCWIDRFLSHRDRRVRKLIMNTELKEHVSFSHSPNRVSSSLNLPPDPTPSSDRGLPCLALFDYK